MATQSTSGKSNTAKPKAGAKRATKAGAKRATKAGAKRATKTAASEGNQARSVVETAVDLPVGAVLGVTDRLTELVEPFTDRSGAEKQIKAYRGRLRRSVKRTERRGATARRQATREAKRTRTRVEREAHKRRRTAETTLKRNRDEVEQRVREAIEEQTSRAQDLVDRVSEQLSALR